MLSSHRITIHRLNDMLKQLASDYYYYLNRFYYQHVVPLKRLPLSRIDTLDNAKALASLNLMMRAQRKMP